MYKHSTSNEATLERIKVKHMRKEEQSTDKLFAAIIDQSEDAIICKDENGVVISWNTAAEKLLGYKESEIKGKSITLIIPTNQIQQFPQRNDQIKSEKQKSSYHTTAITKTGKEINILLTTFPIKNNHGEVIGSSAIIKELKKRIGDKSTDDFINIASHELKTPLTSIKAYAQILERKFKKCGDIESAQYVQKLDNQINKLTYLIRDLIDINKIQNEELLVKKEEFEMEKLVDELIEEVGSLASDIKIIKKGSIKTKIFADRIQISQVIINLLTNAMKFASSSNLLIVHLKQTKKMIMVGIQDFGAGIDIHEQKRIFERFYRINRDHNSEFPGLGVGLYISSEIIKNHNGEIWVKSNKDKGSTFYFSLPI